MRRIFDCIRDSVSIAIPQPTERQHIRNQIDTAVISGNLISQIVHRFKNRPVIVIDLNMVGVTHTA
jgi:hypothetical protein